MTVYKTDASLKGLWSLDEASGVRYDYTVNNNDLTDNNTVGQSTVDKKEGLASASFVSADTEYLSITDASQTGLDITGNISYGCWIKCTDFGVQNTSQCILSKYNPTGNKRAYMLAVNNAEATAAAHFYVYLSNNGTTTALAYTPESGLSEGVWYHAVVVYNGTDIRIYIDGALASNGANNPKTYASGIYDTDADFRLGIIGSTILPFYGLIDEAFVFNRELSATEVLSIYTNGIVGNPWYAYAQQ